MKILVVDDEPIILNGLMTIIKRDTSLHLEMEAANDGVEALQKSQTFKPDLLITDINMPEMTGLELIKNMKQLNLCNHFVILTGYDYFEYALQALRYGVIDYFLKPLNKPEILKIIHKLYLEIATEADDQPNRFLKQTKGATYCRHIKEVLNYIHTNYEQDLCLDQLAESVNLHPTYLSSLFRKETGEKFIHYLHTFRIEKAKQMLKNNAELPIHKIALLVGYENKEHFYKVFKKYAGQTPKTFREFS